MKVAQTCKVAHACDWNLYALAQSYLGCGVPRLIAHLHACAIIPRLRACTLNRVLASLRNLYLGCGPAQMVTAKPCLNDVLNMVVSIIPNHTQKTCSSFVLKSL